MNKRIVLLIVFLLSFSVSAVEFGIAPFIIYDGEGMKISLNSVPSDNVYKQLTEKWLDGLIDFHKVNSEKTGDIYTVIDAYKVCTTEGYDYIIYGFIEKKEDCYFSNLKIYSSSEKKNIKNFYCSDDIEHYERLMNNLSLNVLQGIEEITGISELKEKQNKYRDFEMKVPLSIFYWSPLGNEWDQRVLGICGVNTGLEIYPPLPVKVMKSKLYDVSIKFNVDWSYGVNQPNYYALYLNSLTIVLPVIVHVHYNPKISAYFGCGFGYGLDMVLITPKYEDEKFVLQNILIFETVAGCEFNINSLIDLFCEIDLHIRFKENTYFELCPKIGVNFKFGGKV